ncbi:MAG: CP family cyanate transporter-like MFS transporter [Akkermansiaceae bacterium]
MIAVNLRPAITGIAPLVERMQAGGVGVQIIGLETTIPLVMFGVAGLFVGAIGGRIGFARALGLGLVVLSVGCFVRSSEGSGTNFEKLLGSLLIGSGIAFGNVLLPGLVKSRFPNHVGLMTSLYSSVAWLPTMPQLRGMSESQSYGWPTAMQICGCLASLVIPTLAGRAQSQSSWTIACSGMSIIGVCGILWFPLEWIGAATIVLGLGLNAGFSMSLLLIAMRSRDAETAGNLSSMAQAIGYLAAAPFPWFIGWLHTASDSWTVAYGFLLLPAVCLMLAGALAGRAGFVK